LLNIVHCLDPFGVSLDLQKEIFPCLAKNPKSILVTLTSQLLLLPGLTSAMIFLLDPVPSIALGMIMGACCPGGNVSNLFTQLAKAYPLDFIHPALASYCGCFDSKRQAFSGIYSPCIYVCVLAKHLGFWHRTWLFSTLAIAS
jgi:hypothetical protein